MSTVKPQRKRAARTKAATTPKPTECQQVPVTTMDLPTAAIAASPFQPRREFAVPEIEQLAGSIATDGLIHPIAVRPTADGYELVDGERRLRACRHLGLPTIRAEVGEFSDAQVMRIVVASAMQRRDLNPIEEAIAFKRAIEAGVAAGPTELARQLGVSQGHVSNRLRMLELPEDWQARVISGEIPPTHARHLIKYRDCPRILEEVARAIKGDPWDELYHCKCTVEDFAQGVEVIAREQTCQLGGKYRSSETHWQDVPVFTPTDEQIAELQVIEMDPRPGAKGEPERRAANVELWDKLQAEFLASRDAKAEKRAEKKAAAKPGKELTAAERKQLAAEEKAKAKRQAEQFARRLGEWYTDWMAYLVARRLKTDATMQELLVIACHFADTAPPPSAHMVESLKRACKDRAPDVTTGRCCSPMEPLTQLGEMEIEAVLGQVLSEWFFAGDSGPLRAIGPADLDLLVTYLVIERKAEWRADQAGPLSEAYWNLHSKDQLVDLAKELAVEVEQPAKKGDLVAAFMARNGMEIEPVAFPAELDKIKRPK